MKTIAGPLIRRGTSSAGDSYSAGVPRLRGLDGKGIYVPEFKLFLIATRGRSKRWNEGGKEDYRTFRSDPSMPELVRLLQRFGPLWMEDQAQAVPALTPQTWLRRCRAVVAGSSLP